MRRLLNDIGQTGGSGDMAGAPAKKNTTRPEPLGPHGTAELPSVILTGYNVEVRDDDGFIGDKASRGAFIGHLDELRRNLRKSGDDPLQGKTAEYGKKALEALLIEGDPHEAGLVLSAIENFAQSLAFVVRRFAKLKSWACVERIVVGGGFREGRVGELAIGRAGVILQTEGHKLDLKLIRNHPDEAGLLGNAHLAPKWIFEGFDSLVAVDIGGSNIRVGIVQLRQDKASDLSRARVAHSELWRHADELPAREETIKRLGKMLQRQIKQAEKEGLRVAPFIGVGCPGVISSDGVDRARGAEPARQLGEQPLQPGREHTGDAARNRRPRNPCRSSQRRCHPGPERNAVHAGCDGLGRADHRHRARQRHLSQPRRPQDQGLSRRSWLSA